MKKEIKFSLVYRDMWQSSGKYVPRKDQLEQIAPIIIKMGCFDRVESNGGAAEQVNLLYGENPNHSVRAFTAALHKGGIECHMLDRALNALRMNPVPADVRKLMYKVKKAQGVDITRIFCGLNDVRNIIPSIQWANEAGMISQAAMSITYSPVHTAEYYINMAEQLIQAGAKEIALKDMAGVGRPFSLGKVVAAIKKQHPEIKVQYHGHTGPGLSMASMLEVAQAGADYLDVAMEPLSWGMVHPDVISVQAMLKDAGFLVKDIDMNAYMEARAMTQSFIDDFLGYWIDPRNRYLNSLMLGCGLPGGMMGSLMADLKGVHAAINMNLKNKGEKELTEDELLVQLFDEVQNIWPKLGYPPLVTPFSQYTKNIALMNLYSLSKGDARYENSIDPAAWGMILGKAGQLPGELAPEIVELAKKKGLEFFNGNPQDNYPDELPRFRKEMEENGWDLGPDEEELFEFAMHEKQYREYKSGEAKRRFNQELEEKMKAKFSQGGADVKIPDLRALRHPNAEPVVAPVGGRILWDIDFNDKSTTPAVGTTYKEGDIIAQIQAPYGQEPVVALWPGKIVEAVAPQGKLVEKGETIAFIEK
ncbi:MAG: oxaloacetate decarboxylase [Lentimicrobiaceae bacterium]|nr:oxaloacetate decarboxylase [Lentimicrobiaceae bacterium]MBQ4547720.1 oxaloacetate decarboxylase [Bacteroidales bacterium]